MSGTSLAASGMASAASPALPETSSAYSSRSRCISADCYTHATPSPIIGRKMSAMGGKRTGRLQHQFCQSRHKQRLPPRQVIGWNLYRSLSTRPRPATMFAGGHLEINNTENNGRVKAARRIGGSGESTAIPDRELPRPCRAHRQAILPEPGPPALLSRTER